MATSQQSWRLRSLVLLLAAALALVFLVGSAQACSAGYGNCDGDTSNGCETYLYNNVNNCGYCGNQCPNPQYGTAYCSGGNCYQKCNSGYCYCGGRCHKFNQS